MKPGENTSEQIKVDLINVNMKHAKSKRRKSVKWKAEYDVAERKSEQSKSGKGQIGNMVSLNQTR